MVARSGDLFDSVDLLALPTAIITPPAVSDLEDLDRYIETNRATLRPTGPVSMLGLCALTVPVGLDETGMPVGLQLVAPGGRDELLLAAGLAAERVLGTPSERLGAPPRG
jgi:aspartyl-tRNA(Asn)/glutamyl-tRNA(Gln) amidotransferase subunit A